MSDTYRIYIHYEADTHRPFYVGRSVHKHRPVSDKNRNPFWKAKAAKHGWYARVFGGSFSRDYASKLEKRLIRLYSRKFKLTNLTAGGDGCLGFSHREETRQAMSRARKGIPHTAQWSARISEAQKLRFTNGALPSSTYYTDSSRKLLSAAGKRKKNKPRKGSKPVLCVTTGETFVSCAHAANTHGADKENLRRHLNRKKYYNTIKGKVYQWL